MKAAESIEIGLEVFDYPDWMCEEYLQFRLKQLLKNRHNTYSFRWKLDKDTPYMSVPLDVWLKKREDKTKAKSILYNRKYREKNRDKINRTMRNCRQKNPEKYRAAHRKWYYSNLESVRSSARVRGKRRYYENREELLAKQKTPGYKKWVSNYLKNLKHTNPDLYRRKRDADNRYKAKYKREHREEVLAYHSKMDRRRRAANPEKYRVASKGYYWANPERARAQVAKRKYRETYNLDDADAITLYETNKLMRQLRKEIKNEKEG